MFPDDHILKAFSIVGKSFPVEILHKPACYILDNRIVGMGYADFAIHVKPEWDVVLAMFNSENRGNFHKILLSHRNGLNYDRCHSYYTDENDMEHGGTYTDYQLEEIMASLIEHSMKNSESNCVSCRGESPLQTHYIRLLRQKCDRKV